MDAKKLSRQDFTAYQLNNNNVIEIGCLQRIADSLEVICGLNVTLLNQILKKQNLLTKENTLLIDKIKLYEKQKKPSHRPRNSRLFRRNF